MTYMFFYDKKVLTVISVKLLFMQKMTLRPL